MPTVYVETSIPSYLTAQLSRDLIIAAHQQITQEWWRTARDRFDLYISEAVLLEIRSGDPDASARRVELVKYMPVLAMKKDIQTLVEVYDQCLGLVGRARTDLPHFAFAVAYKMDYIVTWNCTHIANGEVIRRLQAANERLQRPTPIIVTPEALLPESEGE